MYKITRMWQHARYDRVTKAYKNVHNNHWNKEMQAKEDFFLNTIYVYLIS